MKITWDEEPSLTMNYALSEEFAPFPRGEPFTKNNVLKYISGIADGSIKKKGFKLPDSRKQYLEDLKAVTKIKKNK